MDYVLEHPDLIPDGVGEDEFAVIGGLLDDAVIDCAHEISRRTINGVGIVLFVGPHPKTGDDVVYDLKVNPELVADPLLIDRATKLRDLLPLLTSQIQVASTEAGRPLHLSFPDRVRTA